MQVEANRPEKVTNHINRMFAPNQQHDSSDVQVHLLPRRKCLMIIDTDNHRHIAHSSPLASPLTHTAIKTTASHQSRGEMQQKLQICFLLATFVLVFRSEIFMPNVCVFNLKMTTACMQIRRSSRLSVNLLAIIQ